MANYTNVSFAGTALQTANIMINNIQHFGIPAKNMSLMTLDHDNRSVIPFTSYGNRVVLVEGTITGSSIADLDARLDAFKLLFNNQDQNLDIDYNSGTRRYIATLDTSNSTIDRPGGLLYAEFSLQFICTSPFGQDTAASNLLVASNRTLGNFTDAVTVLGTAPYQLPVATFVFNSSATSTTNLVTNPGFEVDLSGWSSGGIGTATRVTTQHNTGIAAMQMVNAASAPLSVPSGGPTYGWELYPLSGLTAGVLYTVTVNVKGNAGGETFKVSTLGSAVQTLTLTTGWQAITFQFIATATTDQIYVWSTTASATWFLDDVSVFANSAAYVQFGNNTTGQQITVNRIWTYGDTLVVDCNLKQVTVNGVIVNWSGAFPELPPGAQSLGYSDSFTSRNFNVTVAQTPLYL